MPPTLPAQFRIFEKGGGLGKLQELAGDTIDAGRAALSKRFGWDADSPANRRDRSNRTPLGVFLELSQNAQQDNYAGVGQLPYRPSEDQPVQIVDGPADGTGGYAGLVQSV